MTRTLHVHWREERRTPGHVTIGVFVGLNENHGSGHTAGGKSGSLVMRVHEWDAVCAALFAGFPGDVCLNEGDSVAEVLGDAR